MPKKDLFDRWCMKKGSVLCAGLADNWTTREKAMHTHISRVMTLDNRLLICKKTVNDDGEFLKMETSDVAIWSYGLKGAKVGSVDDIEKVWNDRGNLHDM